MSHEILREYREFERMSTTVVNAYIGPKVGGYVKSLKADLGGVGFRGDLSIMRSNGGVMTPEVATERPVAMMESGPVGGIIASARVGQALGFRQRDLVRHGRHHRQGEPDPDGEPTMAPGYYVGGYASGHPVMLPMIDVVEVGAGGGIDCLDRRHRRAQGRPAERRRRSGADLLSRRRHRADHHRRQRRARPARPGQFPRRRR